MQKSYSAGKKKVPVLKEVNWAIPDGKWSVLLGASGSGKTTLLNLLGALEKPDAGEIIFAGKDIAQMSAGAKAEYRAKVIGFALPILSS